MLHIHLDNVRGGSSIPDGCQDNKFHNKSVMFHAFTQRERTSLVFTFIFPKLFLYISFHFSRDLSLCLGKAGFFFFLNLENIFLWTFENDIFGFLGDISAEERTINLHTHISAIQEETVRPPKPGKESEIKMIVPFSCNFHYSEY